MKHFRSIAFLVALVSLGIAHPALAVVGDATGLFTITKTGLVLNRATNTFDTTVTIKNASPFTVGAPVQLAVSGLPNGVTLANKSGTASQGNPYVNVPVTGNAIFANQIITPIILKFGNPSRVALTPKLSLIGDIPDAAVGLPPDPGEAGKVTVEGTDSNANGVRDDVERWIAFNFPVPTERDAMTQAAQALQTGLQHASNPALATTDSLASVKATQCVGYRFSDLASGEKATAELLSKMLNTGQRLQAKREWTKNTGPLLIERFVRDGCDF